MKKLSVRPSYGLARCKACCLQISVELRLDRAGPFVRPTHSWLSDRALGYFPGKILMEMVMSLETLHNLALYDTPTICNVIELFDVRPRNAGYMDGRIRAAFPQFPPMVGFATTAAFRSDAPPGKGDAYGSLEAQLATFAALPGPAVVVFQDLDDPAVSATFGEVMCSTYQGFGSTGLITSGAGRDLEQVRALSYPVFTGGTNCSHGYCHILHIGLPVRVGGLIVNPGDLLHGDANGVTNIPIGIAPAVADFAAEFVDAERVLMDYVRGTGRRTVDGFTAARQEFARHVADLAARARAWVAQQEREKG